MKKYDKPLITNFNDGSFVIPAIFAPAVAIATVKAATKLVDKMFESSFANAQRLGSLEPVIA